MTKADLIDEVAKNSDLSKKDAEAIVQAVLDSIVESLKGGGKVELRGFGSFRLRERSSREGRNPKPARRFLFPPRKCPISSPGRI